MKPNLRAYKEVVSGHLDGLESRENAAMHNGRLAYVRRVPCALGAAGRGYAYLCLDTAMRRELERDAARRAAEAYDSMAAKDVFVLAGTRRIAREKLLPLYYTRDRVEKFSRSPGRAARRFPSACRRRRRSAGISSCASWPPPRSR